MKNNNCSNSNIHNNCTVGRTDGRAGPTDDGRPSDGLVVMYYCIVAVIIVVG